MVTWTGRSCRGRWAIAHLTGRAGRFTHVRRPGLALLVAALALVVASATAPPSSAATATGTITFRGDDLLPSEVELLFVTLPAVVFRTVPITGKTTVYSVDIPLTDYDGVDARLISRPPGSFWAGYTAALGAPPRPVGEVGPAVVGPIVFDRVTRVVGPLRDQRGQPFALQPGQTVERSWAAMVLQSQAVLGTASLGGYEAYLAGGSYQVKTFFEITAPDGPTSFVTGIAPERVSVSSDTAGTTVTGPPVVIDATPPAATVLSPPEAPVAKFAVSDPESGMDLTAEAAVLRPGRPDRVLPQSRIDTIIVNHEVVGYEVRPDEPGEMRIRLCTGNRNGVVATGDRCGIAVVGRGAREGAAPCPRCARKAEVAAAGAAGGRRRLVVRGRRRIADRLEIAVAVLSGRRAVPRAVVRVGGGRRAITGADGLAHLVLVRARRRAGSGCSIVIRTARAAPLVVPPPRRGECWRGRP